MKIFSLVYSNFAHLDKVFPDAQLIGPDDVVNHKISKGDIVIFHGGTDINAALYGEVPSKYNDSPDHGRDAYEIDIYKECVEVGAFCLGICRGAQLLCVLNGGKLIQHIADGSHRMCNHELTFTKDNLFYDRPITTNSDHHQAMLPSKEGVLIAYHKDICEMVWYPLTSTFCVQGHPEWLSDSEEFVVFVNNFIKEHM